MDDIESELLILKARSRTLKQTRYNILSFNSRYAAFINDSDGIFGLFSDEIVVNILSYLYAKIILHIICKRFYALRIDALKLRAEGRLRNIPKNIISDCINKIVKSELKFYYALNQQGIDDFITRDGDRYNLRSSICYHTLNKHKIITVKKGDNMRMVYYELNKILIIRCDKFRFRIEYVDDRLQYTFTIDEWPYVYDGISKHKYVCNNDKVYLIYTSKKY
jgi:hypothetical protein